MTLVKYQQGPTPHAESTRKKHDMADDKPTTAALLKQLEEAQGTREILLVQSKLQVARGSAPRKD